VSDLATRTELNEPWLDIEYIARDPADEQAPSRT